MMKFFASSGWKAGAAGASTIGTVLAAFGRLRGVEPAQPLLDRMRRSARNGVAYRLSPEFIRSFATSGLPFLAYYEFCDLAGWHRDTYFAPDHVDGYSDAIGKSYTVWTYETTSQYRRHIFLDRIGKDMAISFEVPSLQAASWFPLRIRVSDGEGLYFQQDQKLVVDRLCEGRASLTSWRKIDGLREALARLHRRTGSQQ